MKLKFTFIAILAMLFGFTFTANAQQAVEVATLGELQTALSGDGSSVVITKTIVIPQGETVVLDLNGKTVTREDEANQYALRNLGTLTIQDTKGNGSINARGIYNGYGDGAANVATAKITVLSGTINAKGTNGGAAIFNYGIADIQGGTFTSIGGYSLNNQAGAEMNITDGVEVTGGIYNNQDAELTVDGGNISNNRSGCHTIYAWNAKVTVNGGSIHNENSGNATIMSAGTSEVTINGGTISIANGKSTNGWTSCLIDATGGGKYEINGGEFKGHFRVQANCAMEINGGTFENTHGEAYVNGGTVAVKGGTFTDAAAQKFATDNLADASSVVENPDGTFSVGKPVATLADLQAALAAENELPIIITAQIVIPEGTTVELDLNGKTVNSVFNGTSTTNHIYALSNKGTLTIKDSKGNGSINSRGIYNYGSLTLNAGAINAIDGNGGYAVNNQSGSTFVMNGGVVAATYEDDYKNTDGGYDATALKVPTGCTATLNGGTINNVCDYTYAIDAAGTLNIPAASTITVNGTHGAIYVSGGLTTIDAGTFQIPADEYKRTDNVLYVSGGSLVVNGGTFIGDSDTAAGGSCLSDAAGKAVVNGGTFKGSSGGDVWGTTGTTIKGGTFENLTEKQHIAEGYELGEDGKVTSSVAYVAMIGEQGYETLAAALEATKTMTGDVTVEILDKVTFNQPLIGSYSSINFVGKDTDAEIYLDIQGYIEAAGKVVTFTDLILSKVQGGYVANAGFMNLAFGVFGVTEATYTNCTFANGAYASTGKVTYTDCTFKPSWDRYAFWAYGDADITIDGCTFDAARGIKMYDEGKERLAAVTVKNSDFSAVTDKPAIVLTSGEKVTLASNRYSSTGVFELDLDGVPNGTPVTSDVLPTCVNDNGACGVLVDGVIYTTVAQAAAVATSGSNVTLLHNSNETVKFAYGVVLDKNGFTADNVTTAQPVAKIGEQGYATLSEAFAAVTDDNQTVVLLADVTENLAGAYLRGNITTENGATVTVNLTNSDWVYCPYTFVIGENVTLNVPALFYYAGGSVINGTVVAGAYYQSNAGTKLTINEPGSMTVTGETCIIRYMEGDPNAGIYVVGDNNNETIGLKLSVAYFYQGMINAKNANINVGVYWQTNETDGQGSANLVLDNSTLNVTVNEHNFKATGNSTVTLTNGSSIVIAGAFKTGENTEVSVDATSSITDKNGQVKFGLSGEGTVDNPYLISSVDDLVLFRNSVNAGETKYNTAGVWVALGGDIDLTSIENWEPIGTWDYSFDANFDGKGCKIMNLKMSDNTAANGEAYLGFFGITANNVIKNLVIENVTIASEGQIVAAAIAYPYYTTVSDITVCGDIAIKGGNYTAGVLAYTRLCQNASNLAVVGNEGSCIEGARAVGGVIADIQMNNGLVANYSNFSAEGVAVKGTKMVGGISGIISTQTLNGATVKNVTLSSGDSRVGTIAGAFGATSTISNVTVENVTGATAIVGPTYDGAKAVEARIGDTYYATLQAAVDAVEEKGTVTLLADVDASEITTGKNFTIALNGNECDVTLPEGYAALPDLNGNYVIGAKPTATVNNLGMTTVAAGDYSIWDGSFDSNTEDDGDMPLSFVMQFLADQDAEDMATSPFADWYGDFVLTFTGLENGSFTADNCYLAGHYGSFGWVKIPVDGMVIEDGARYPVMLGVGMGQKYDYICSSVEDFKCALYLAPEILEANPNIQVKLELGVVDNSKGSDAAASALMNNDNVYSVTEYTYDALDFDPSYIAEFVIDDANSVDYTFTEEKTVGTLTYKRNLIEGIWNPLYLPFQISVEELVENYDIAYYNQMISIDTNNDGAFDDYEMEVAYITTGTLRANYPYFIRPKSAEACALEYVAEDVTLYPAVEKTIQTSSVANIFTLSGTHKAMSEEELDGYLAVSYNGAWEPSTGIKAHRLYFKIEENDNSPFATTAAKSIRIVARGEGDGTTGVEEVETENGEVKAIYDLTGRRVQETVKSGIYIVNGKKVLVK